MQQTFLKLVSIYVCQWGLFGPTCTFVPDNQQQKLFWTSVSSLTNHIQ